MKKNLNKMLKFFINPRLLFCLLVAWFITNGWSYVLFAISSYFHLKWLQGFSGAYLAFLWLPISPEKVVTIAIAIVLLKFIFPNDKNTLAVLENLFYKAKETLKKKNNKSMDNQQEKNSF